MYDYELAISPSDLLLISLIRVGYLHRESWKTWRPKQLLAPLSPYLTFLYRRQVSPIDRKLSCFPAPLSSFALRQHLQLCYGSLGQSSVSARIPQSGEWPSYKTLDNTELMASTTPPDSVVLSRSIVGLFERVIMFSSRLDLRFKRVDPSGGKGAIVH